MSFKDSDSMEGQSNFVSWKTIHHINILGKHKDEKKQWLKKFVSAYFIKE